jgi:hypothetical protein
MSNRVTSSPKYSAGMGSSDPHAHSSIGSPRSNHGIGSQHEGGNSSYGPLDDSNSMKSSGLYIPSVPRYVPSSGNSPAYLPRSGSSEYGAASVAASSGEPAKAMYDPTATNNKPNEQKD